MKTDTKTARRSKENKGICKMKFICNLKFICNMSFHGAFVITLLCINR